MNIASVLSSSLILVSLLAGAADRGYGQEEPFAGAGAGPVEAVSYAAIPPGASFATQPQTSTEIDEAAWGKVDAILLARGYRIDDDARLVLTVETSLSDQPGDFASPFNYSEKSAGVSAGGNIYSTQGGSLINPGIPAPRFNRVFRVAVSVHDRNSGLYVWRGSIERLDSSHDPHRALEVMAPELLRYLGVTVIPAQ